jgi:hypothetical protein
MTFPYTLPSVVVESDFEDVHTTIPVVEVVTTALLLALASSVDQLSRAISNSRERQRSERQMT